MERETLDFLLSQLFLTLEKYTDLEHLKNDLREYTDFMADVYDHPNYFSEFYTIKQRFHVYLKQHHYKTTDFTRFQRHLILRCLFENYSFADLDQFAQIHISDEEMERGYQASFRK